MSVTPAWRLDPISPVREARSREPLKITQGESSECHPLSPDCVRSRLSASQFTIRLATGELLQMWTHDSLDIVIPAYKAKFLPTLLRSLVNQSSKNFAVIVSDDASPERLKPICDLFRDRLRIRYVRFERNLGATDLAGHWNRSVALSSAQWVLLPGDDDVLEVNCIESFWNTVTECDGKSDVFSFGVRVIDENDRITRDGIPAAATASAGEYLKQRLAHEILAVPAAYVFSRRSFEEFGGFVGFDQGWHSDDATWALFGARGGIKPIEDAFIRWRVSGLNLSLTMARDHFRQAQATLAFLRWMVANSSRLGLTGSELRQLTDDSICWPLYGSMARVSGRDWLPAVWRIARLLRRHSSKSLPRHLYRFARERVAHRSV